MANTDSIPTMHVLFRGKESRGAFVINAKDFNPSKHTTPEAFAQTPQSEGENGAQKAQAVKTPVTATNETDPGEPQGPGKTGEPQGPGAATPEPPATLVAPVVVDDVPTANEAKAKKK